MSKIQSFLWVLHLINHVTLVVHFKHLITLKSDHICPVFLSIRATQFIIWIHEYTCEHDQKSIKFLLIQTESSAKIIFCHFLHFIRHISFHTTCPSSVFQLCFKFWFNLMSVYSNESKCSLRTIRKASKMQQLIYPTMTLKQLWKYICSNNSK